MLQLPQHASLEEAGSDLRRFILDPANWVALESLAASPELRPGQNPSYQRLVGNMKVCASIDVTDELRAFVRIAFRGPGLSPLKAADCLEAFVKGWLPWVPNSEWRVEIDARRWIHFIRPYTGSPLSA